MHAFLSATFCHSVSARRAMYALLFATLCHSVSARRRRSGSDYSPCTSEDPCDSSEPTTIAIAVCVPIAFCCLLGLLRVWLKSCNTPAAADAPAPAAAETLHSFQVLEGGPLGLHIDFRRYSEAEAPAWVVSGCSSGSLEGFVEAGDVLHAVNGVPAAGNEAAIQPILDGRRPLLLAFLRSAARRPPPPPSQRNPSSEDAQAVLQHHIQQLNHLRDRVIELQRALPAHHGDGPPDARGESDPEGVSAAPAGASLPPGWEMRTHPQSGRLFYDNLATGETQWHAPGGPPLPPGWERHVDPRSGRTYYDNIVTGETQWYAPQ